MRFIMTWTQLPCESISIEKDELDMKVDKHRPDQGIIEYEHFFPMLSYYLPHEDMRRNEDFVLWMRNTPNLADQYASELMYNLPAPRESHYQEEFREMRRKITRYLTEVEEFLGYYPI